MKKLNELGGLRAFRVDTITFGPDADESGNAHVHISIPENFLPIALTGKIGALLIPATGEVTKNPTGIVRFHYIANYDGTPTRYDANWTNWNADVGSKAETTPELRFNGDDTPDSILDEGFEKISKNELDGSIIAKPDIPLYVIGVATTLYEEN